jgi:thioredoxin 1
MMNQDPTPGAAERMAEMSNSDDLNPIITGAKKTMVLFEMTGCPYCLTFESRFLDFSKEHSEDFNFVRVKLDDPANPLWEKYNIFAVPTVILFSRGEIVSRVDSILAFGLSKRMWGEFCVGL